jgi:endonuclease/exonuclease/phosphatase family metal-dependent hydrolase
MKYGRFSHLIFFSLTIVLGMQAIRLLLPLLLYVVSDNFGFDSTFAGVLAFAIFASSFLGGWLRRRVSLTALCRIAALIIGFCLTLASFFFQMTDATFSPAMAAFPLLLVMVAVAAFIQFLPHTLLQSGGQTAGFVLSFLFALAVDTTLHGLMATYDFAWHSPAFTFILFLGQIILLRASNWPPTSPVVLRRSWLLLIIGPYLFLQLLLLQNMARLTAVTGWWPEVAFGWAVLAHIVGLATAVYLLRQTGFMLFYGLGLAFLLFLATSSELNGAWAAGQFLLGQMGAAGLLALSLTKLKVEAADGQAKSGITAYGIGLIFMTAITFLYYIGYQLPLPFANSVLPPIAAIVIITIAAPGFSARPAPDQRPAFPIWLPFLLLLGPIYALTTRNSPAVAAGTGYPVRVMSYNLHNGFNSFGYLGLEAIAQTIEAQRPDVMALQEVSRGWVVNGSADMLTWLSRRLGMPYIWGPTADPLLGSALLSRYPIGRYELHLLPTADLPYQRGFIFAEIIVGSNQTLNVIATHFHHLPDGSEIRQQQAQAIFDARQNQVQTVIMGDLNATPDTPEIALIHEAGFSDILAEVEGNSTFPSLNSDRQLDYILLSSDLTADDITIAYSLASDHLAIAATIRP